MAMIVPPVLKAREPSTQRQSVSASETASNASSGVDVINSHSAPAVVAEEVVLRYRNGRGLGPATLVVQPGSVLALMGPNGAGKTTLLRLLATRGRPSRGRIKWWGDPDPSHVWRQLGVSFDVPVEEERLTAAEAVYFWACQWIGESQRARKATSAILSQFGLSDVQHDLAGSFSFGMRRRLLLAAALVHSPGLALLDEPSSGLDPEGMVSLRRHIQKRCECGQTTIIASNDAPFVAGVATEVVFLNKGLVCGSGTPSALLEGLDLTTVAELTTGRPAVAEAWEGLAGVVAVSVSGMSSTVSYKGSSTLPLLVQHAHEQFGGVVSLSVREPDLSDCFLQLTGHSLNEKGAPA